MGLTLENLKKMFAAAARDIDENEAYLCSLDAVCGDGDHGVAIRGAIDAAADAVAAAPDVKNAFSDAGMAAMGNSNGSTSSIYGTLLMGIGDAIKSAEPEAAEIAEAFESALASMREVVKGDVGDKTCFDALIPAIAAMKGRATVAELFAAAADAAKKGADGTVDLVAKFGRARNLGEKSRGPKDPGAVSNAMIFAAFARVLSK